MATDSAPEGGYGWVVVTATFFVYYLSGMLVASFPVMYREYMVAFDTGSVAVGAILSYSVISSNVTGPLSYFDLYPWQDITPNRKAVCWWKKCIHTDCSGHYVHYFSISSNKPYLSAVYIQTNHTGFETKQVLLCCTSKSMTWDVI